LIPGKELKYFEEGKTMGEAIAGRTNETAGNPLLDLVRGGDNSEPIIGSETETGEHHKTASDMGNKGAEPGLTTDDSGGGKTIPYSDNGVVEHMGSTSGFDKNPDRGRSVAPDQQGGNGDETPERHFDLGKISCQEEVAITKNPDGIPRVGSGDEQPASKIPDRTFYGDVPIPSKGLGRVEDGDKLATNPLAVEKLSSKQTLENTAHRLTDAYKVLMPKIPLHKWDEMGPLLEEYLIAEEEFCIQMRCRVNDEVLPENRVDRENFLMILMKAACSNPYDEWSTETVRWFNAQMEPDECEGILKVYFRGWVMVEKLGEILTVATKEVILCNIFNHGCPETVESHGVPTTMMSNLELF
jgi:hypothetical protein